MPRGYPKSLSVPVNKPERERVMSGENTITVDGGTVTVEPASEGRALLTVHELRHCNAVVRLTRPQLSAAIDQMVAIRDGLPEVAPDVVGDEEDA